MADHRWSVGGGGANLQNINTCLLLQYSWVLVRVLVQGRLVRTLLCVCFGRSCNACDHHQWDNYDNGKLCYCFSPPVHHPPLPVWSWFADFHSTFPDPWYPCVTNLMPCFVLLLNMTAVMPIVSSTVTGLLSPPVLWPLWLSQPFLFHHHHHHQIW